MSKVVGSQIKCLLELNCVCLVPFNLARAFVALGSRVVEGTKGMPSSGCYDGPDANSCWSWNQKRASLLWGSFFFIMDAT